MKKFLKKNIVIIGLTLLMPGIVAFLIRNSFSNYKSLVLPKLAPPSYIFPIMWSILYILMSISAIFTKNNDKCLKVYYLQLIINVIWSPIFFYFGNYLLAMIDLIILFILVVYMMYLFYKEYDKTIYLLVPYVLWLIFAGYLNYFVYLYN
jgi:tryptophan-rich sensory protein